MNYIEKILLKANVNFHTYIPTYLHTYHRKQVDLKTQRSYIWRKTKH